MKTITRPAVASLCILFASTAYGFGGGSCIPVTGVVQSVPDPTCGVLSAMNGWPQSEAPDQFLAALPPTPGVGPGDVCLAIKGFGTAQFSGFSGLTAVPVGNWTPSQTGPTTPFVPLAPTSSTLNPYGATPFNFATGVRAGLTVFTSQAVLKGKVYAGRKLLEGSLYTKDTGVIELAPTGGKVGQILKIVGGNGAFAGASGTITVAGQELGGFAFYSGEVCGAK